MRKKFLFLTTLLSTLTLSFFACSADNEAINMQSANNFNVKSTTVNRLANLKDTELSVLIDYNRNDDTFKEILNFQYTDDVNMFDVTKVKNIDVLSIDDHTAKLNIDNTIYVLTNDDNYKKIAGEVVYIGYGLSHTRTEGKFQLIKDITIPVYTIRDLVVVNGVEPTDPVDTMTCNSGGAGSSSCSIDEGVASISTGCSVTCREGSYSCCETDRVLCRCIAEKASDTLKQPANLSS